MLNLLKFIFVITCLLLSKMSYAEDMFVDTNILYTIPDAGGSDDFHTGKIIHINYNYYYLPWLAVTSGAFFSEEIFDEPRTDIVGTYQASVKTYGVTIGLRPEYTFSKRNKIYGKAGILLYDTKLNVQEFFEAGSPGGTSSDSTDGDGYFLAIGWAHSFTDKVSFQLELNSQVQLDLFDGETSADNVFDLTNSGFSVGLAYAF
ncbi:MAG: hypothetical protein DIZ80_11540 [endosymbiont of Galathealinum brachiosum]|uniref:Outer membrane protein beta-barrel domain-containing protein n=1 Tax=endosymbiont of Galathealinum brachiosum TaxID=2200906 RepID=A0A370DEV1_9GAMM|nr:MAG: hypothetical protein DIZ80_11540 [endosymbiont of Galathealinum brachiosum]